MNLTTTKKGCIYIHTCLITGKSYIGQTTQTMDKRWASHCKRAMAGSNTHFHRAIRKYGVDNWSHKVLLTNISTDIICQLEVAFISTYNTFECGYNATKGGEGTVGNKLTAAHKAILKAVHTGNSYGLGWRPSEEQKNKQRKSLKGRVVSEKTKAKLRARTGIKHHNAKLVDIVSVISGEIIATNVVIREWVRHNTGYDQAALNRTALNQAKQHKGIRAVPK